MTAPEIANALHDSRAARGAALLDEKFPDWALRINLAHLHMSRPENCILGQLSNSLGFIDRDGDAFWGASSYSAIFFYLARSQSDSVGSQPDDEDTFTSEFGFDSPADWDWDGLTRAWERQINARLANSTVGTAPQAADVVV